jgi:hypothetical protein
MSKYPSLKKLKKICRDEGISCKGTKAELRVRLLDHFQDLAELTYYGPNKYFLAQDEEQIKEFYEAKAERENKPVFEERYQAFITDIKEKPDAPSEEEIFHQFYPNVYTLKDMEKVSGVPLEILEKIYNDSNIESVYSFLVKGCDYYKYRKEAEQAIKQSTTAKLYFNTLTCACNQYCL